MAITDDLTGLLNRREADRRLRQEVARAHRYDRPLAVLMIDVDDLKLVNDRLGHPLGDEVLSALSRVLGSHIRATDIAGRLGGDDFLVAVADQALYAAKKAGKNRKQVAGGADDLTRASASVG